MGVGEKSQTYSHTVVQYVYAGLNLEEGTGEYLHPSHKKKNLVAPPRQLPSIPTIQREPTPLTLASFASLALSMHVYTIPPKYDRKVHFAPSRTCLD